VPAHDQQSTGKTLRLSSGAQVVLEAKNPRPSATLDAAEYAKQRVTWFNSLTPRIRRELPQPGREGNPWPGMDPDTLRRALQARLIELRRLESDRSLVLTQVQNQERRLRALQRLEESTERALQSVGR
jgi:hypothetical protein